MKTGDKIKDRDNIRHPEIEQQGPEERYERAIVMADRTPAKVIYRFSEEFRDALELTGMLRGEVSGEDKRERDEHGHDDPGDQYGISNLDVPAEESKPENDDSMHFFKYFVKQPVTASRQEECYYTSVLLIDKRYNRFRIFFAKLSKMAKK